MKNDSTCTSFFIFHFSLIFNHMQSLIDRHTRLVKEVKYTNHPLILFV